MSDDLFELGERIADLAARINIATFDMLTLVAEFDRREGWADNFASCAEWLAWRTGRTLAAARENVRVAHALEELPLTATAMKSGQLSYTKVRTMTRVATPETEATLLKYARSTSAARLEWLARGWKTLSRDGELARPRRSATAAAPSRWRSTPTGCMWCGGGWSPKSAPC